MAQHEIFNIISRDREILRKITQNFGSGSVLFTKLHDLTPTKKFTSPPFTSKSVTGFFRRVFSCALLSSHARITSQRGLVCQSVIKQWVLDHEFSLFFFFCFVFSRKAVTLDDGKIQRTLSVYWGKYTGKGPNKKIAKATAAKLAIEGLKKKSSEENAAVYIRQFAEPHQHKTRKRKLNELFTGIPMKIHKCSSNQAE